MKPQVVSDINLGTMQFVSIGSKTLTWRDGQTISTKGFSITQEPVNVREFREFARATGYVTKAELMIDDAGAETYCNNQMTNSLLASINLKTIPAVFVSYTDATAFCEWCGCALPSENELIAAWLMTDEILDEVQDERKIDTLADKARKSAVKGHFPSLTKTMRGDKVVVRFGPYLAKIHRPNDVDWVDQYELVDDSDARLDFGFYVVRR